MRRQHPVILFCLLFCLISCKNDSAEMDPNIEGCWANAQEEGEHLYKACDAQVFAPSRFRQTYTFNANGSCEFLVLHPADAHYTREAEWRYDSACNEIHIIDPDSDEVLKRLRFTRLTEDSAEIITLN